MDLLHPRAALLEIAAGWASFQQSMDPVWDLSILQGSFPQAEAQGTAASVGPRGAGFGTRGWTEVGEGAALCLSQARGSLSTTGPSFAQSWMVPLPKAVPKIRQRGGRGEEGIAPATLGFLRDKNRAQWCHSSFCLHVVTTPLLPLDGINSSILCS